MPFIKALDKQYLKEEAEAAENKGSSDANLDSIDLDSIKL